MACSAAVGSGWPILRLNQRGGEDEWIGHACDAARASSRGVGMRAYNTPYNWELLAPQRKGICLLLLQTCQTWKRIIGTSLGVDSWLRRAEQGQLLARQHGRPFGEARAHRGRASGRILDRRATLIRRRCARPILSHAKIPHAFLMSSLGCVCGRE